jgi:O-acetyl-ADP-ribose deacetylase (regulator of RNase III)
VITYVRGDATNPLGPGPKCIIHIVNDIGKFGKGFVLALARKWPSTREKYLAWYQQEDFKLGRVLYMRVCKDIWVAHMIAQHGIKTGSNGPPIRYAALEECLEDVGRSARLESWSIHGPKFGAGLAGGTWSEIEPILERTLDGISVTIYEQ